MLQKLFFLKLFYFEFCFYKNMKQRSTAQLDAPNILTLIRNAAENFAFTWNNELHWQIY